MADLVGPIQIKRGTSSQWASTNVALRDGELGVDTTRRRMKIGDGGTAWADLAWVTPDVATVERLEALASVIDGAIEKDDAFIAFILSSPGSESRDVLADILSGEDDVIQAAAALAQSAAGVVLVSDPILPQPALEDDTFIRAITDSREKVIFGIRRDGSVLAPDLEAFWARIGELTASKVNGVTISSSLVSITGYRRVWTDDQDNVLWGIRPDGTLHIPSLEANIATTSGVPTKYKASYGDTERAIVSGPGVTLAGHSMLAGAANAISAALSGVSVVSLSVGGESSRTIAARQGGQPLLFVPSGGSLPASGSVDVDLLWADGPVAGGWPLLQGATSYAGTLVLPSGTRVAGTFSIVRDPSATQYVHHAGDRYTFTRSTNGSAITVNRPAPFYADVATPRRSDIFVYWIARNNINEVDQAIGDLQAMIQRQDNLAKRWLVLSEHNSATEPSGSGNFANVTSYNQRARALAGRRFVDTRQYLIDYGLADAGITPTTQDQTDIANGVVPTSLRSDNLHLNASGSAVVAQLIRRRLIELEWMTP